MLEERFGRHPVEYWVDRFEARNVACAPLHKLDQVMTHPQVLANAMVVEARRIPTAQRSNWSARRSNWAKAAAPPPSAPPALGADTDAILADTLGLSAAEIDALRAAGAFSAA